MKTRSRFAAEFKAKVALEAIRGKMISDLATKTSSTRTRSRSGNGKPSEPAKAFDKASDAQVDRKAEVTELHAKIGQLVVEREFWPRPSIAEPGSEENDDRPRLQLALDPPPVRTGLDLAGVILSTAPPRDA